MYRIVSHVYHVCMVCMGTFLPWYIRTANDLLIKAVAAESAATLKSDAAKAKAKAKGKAKAAKPKAAFASTLSAVDIVAAAGVIVDAEPLPLVGPGLEGLVADVADEPPAKKAKLDHASLHWVRGGALLGHDVAWQGLV